MSPLSALRREALGRTLLSLYLRNASSRKAILPRCISTGNKSSDTATVKQDVSAVQDTGTTKNWMSYGYDMEDEKTDRNAANSSLFFSITVCIVLGGFFFTYQPDYQLRDWSQREAYLQLRHREQNGLPLIDPNYIDPASIELPSDEELGETEIII
ncbi:NADH dehydrogenase [ubiquinone] 1 beta subcomplex subunit 11, mitochondrial [Ischnura elegans]|uniref:NADH dehydrogenase [ubiquinone] 1 beta subcomplex subunit 11, mitochondrial n=1 Tax=Ischnura elegans TaxID=197161 RepID=UPI001ED873C6|nr:NADH dehydrogenase [ubiquinone] 1 beta subcomplex subunit 11, mitochondrial [Ischnura elegans]